MKIMVGMHHPKQFWIFKNFILEGRKKGWKFIILVSKKDVITQLLDANGIGYIQVGTHKRSTIGQTFEALFYIINSVRYSLKYKPDIFLGRCFPHFAIASKMSGKPFFVIEDSAGSNQLRRIHKLTFPFIKKIFTPTSYNGDFKEKHIRVPSYDELLYLHPTWFKPNKDVLRQYGIIPEDKYAILRFVAWTAHHDFGETGINLETKKQIIKKLIKAKYKIIISSEDPLENDLAEYQMNITPKDMHHLLAYATLFIGDSQTMSTESALLGTVSIRSNSFVGTNNDEGNFSELENRYKLMYNISNSIDIIAKLDELLKIDNIKDIWQAKRNNVLNDKIDYTSFLLWYFETFEDHNYEIDLTQNTFANFK